MKPGEFSKKIKEGKYFIINPNEYKGKWNKLFNNNNPIYIEIGMGKGNFIIQNAINNPNINYIGIEMYDSVILRAIQKTNELELNNLYLVRMDARLIEDIFDKEIPISGNLSNEIFYSFYSYTFKFSGNSS